jgi:hypothetical protein
MDNKIIAEMISDCNDKLLRAFRLGDEKKVLGIARDMGDYISHLMHAHELKRRIESR